jgi:hypothetical protein
MAAKSRRELHQKIDRSYGIEVGGCLGPCKFLGLNRTKLFHVKHLGAIARQHTMYKTPPQSTVKQSRQEERAS